MSTTKCPECGLVNFASAAECKRCHFKFNESKPRLQPGKLKCPECGLVNFADATECKRCNRRLSEPEPQADVPSAPVATAPVPPEQPAPESNIADILEEPRAAVEVGSSPPTPPEYFVGDPAPYTVAMILFAIMVGLSTLLLVYQLKEYSSFFGGEYWKALTNPTHRHYLPTLELLFFFQWIVKMLALSASVLFIFLFLRKSYAFLRWVRVYLIAGFIFILVDGLAVWRMEVGLREKELGRAFQPFIDRLHLYFYLYAIALVLTLLWFGYFTLSKRVEKTFIN